MITNKESAKKRILVRKKGKKKGEKLPVTQNPVGIFYKLV